MSMTTRLRQSRSAIATASSPFAASPTTTTSSSDSARSQSFSNHGVIVYQEHADAMLFGRFRILLCRCQMSCIRHQEFRIPVSAMPALLSPPP